MIRLIRYRIADLNSIGISTTRESGESRFESLEQKIDDALIEVFGDNTIEYRRFRAGGLDATTINMMRATPLCEEVQGYGRGIDQAISNLQTAVDLLREKLQDLGEAPEGRTDARSGS